MHHLFLLKQTREVPKTFWKEKKMQCLLLYLAYFLDLHTHCFEIFPTSLKAFDRFQRKILMEVSFRDPC